MEQKYKVEIPSLDYFQRLISCQDACPVKTPAGRYVTAIAGGDYERAYQLARGPNPFVYSCGRVCDHPCETACRRGAIDEPISIRAMKRTATEHHNLGLGHGVGLFQGEKKAPKIAIVGGGPCGLSAAHDLVKKGYQVTIFEPQAILGGMLNLGIPVYRLPRDIIKLEVDAISNLGVELRTRLTLGKDFYIKNLKEWGYEAIFLATGAYRSSELKIEGDQLDGVFNGVDFLLNANLGYKVEIGNRVAVIGGGNVAIDVARTSMRLGAGRISLIRVGTTEVDLLYRRSESEMPARNEEIKEAKEEGVTFQFLTNPTRILGDDRGKVVGLELIRMRLGEPDTQGRPRPLPVPGSEFTLPVDTVVLAIGQAPDTSFLMEEDRVKISSFGFIEVEPETLRTSAEGIFAGGDVAFGPRSVIQAVADGQRAAISIDLYLGGGKDVKEVGRMTPIADHRMPEDYMNIARQEPPTLSLDRRIGISEVELGFSDEVAKKEGERCLKCFINTIFNREKCILCGGCVDICPYYCLRLVRLRDIEEKGEIEKLIKAFPPSNEKEELVAIIKDEDRCIRCGLCARRCPTGAITMEEFEFSEEVILEEA